MGISADLFQQVEYPTGTLNAAARASPINNNFPKEELVWEPSDERKKRQRCEEILAIQSYGLKKRYEHIGAKTAVCIKTVIIV